MSAEPEDPTHSPATSASQSVSNSLDLSYDPLGDEFVNPAEDVSLYTVVSTSSPKVFSGVGLNECLEPDVFEEDDDDEELDDSGDSTKTVISPVTSESDEVEPIMPPKADPAPKFINTYRKCLMKWEDAFEDLDLDAVPHASLAKLVDDLKGLTSQMQEVQLHFLGEPSDQFPEAEQNRAAAFRKKASTLTKQIYKVLRDEEDGQGGADDDSTKEIGDP